MTMEKEEAAARMRQESLWMLDQDIAATVAHVRERLQEEYECARAVNELDALWRSSGLQTEVASISEKLGSRYVHSGLIDPSRYTDGFGITDHCAELPLRLGARVREVILHNYRAAGIDALRGNLLLYRTATNKSKWDCIQEKGVFVFLVQFTDQPQPQLVYGNIDMQSTLGGELSSEEVTGIECLLGGADGPLWGKRKAVTAQDLPAPVLPEAALQQRIEQAKRVTSLKDAHANPSDRTTWQQQFNSMYGPRKKDSTYKPGLQLLLESGFATHTEKRFFRRDIVTQGFLRQNQQPFIEPTSAQLAVNQALRQFFVRVYDPVQSSPAQLQHVRDALDHATNLELVGSQDVTELDVARAVVARRVKDTTVHGGYLLPTGQAIEAVRRAIQQPSYEDYPETKAVLDTYFPSSTGHTILEEGMLHFRRKAVAEGREPLDLIASKIIGGGKRTIATDIAALRNIAPSPLAFPYD